MQVNNNIQPSFKSLYIIQGTANKVDKASTLIRRACNNIDVHHALAFEHEIAGKIYEYPETVIGKFTDCAYYYLTNVYDQLQPFVQNLIGTNEDAKIISEYLSDGIPEEEEYTEADYENLKNMVADTIKKQEANQKEYDSAKEQCYAGNSAPLAKIVVNNRIEAKKRLAEILAPYGILPEEVHSISADKVIEAIENDQFLYTKGHIVDEYYESEN